MTSSQSKLKRPDIQPQPERGFAGRAPLISGMFAKRDQLMASAVILKLASRAVVVRESEANYAKLLCIIAKGISEKRRSAKISALIDEAMVGMDGAPETKREALEMALRKKGIRAEILDERQMANFSFFKLRVGTQERTVPLPNNVSIEEAVPAFEDALSVSGLGGSTRDLMKSRKKENGSIRPPPKPIDLDQELLEKRKISYDGQINEEMLQFTYYADSIGTSFGLPAHLRNGQLLAEIDRRIIGLHESYDVPLDTSVLEQQASEKGRYRVPKDSEVERIANAIQYLIENNIHHTIIPEEFAEAVEKLRSSQEYTSKKSAVPLSGEEAKEFADAFRLLDNPAHAMVRMLHPHFCGKDGELTDEGKGIIRETLELGDKEKVNINGAALANIATAFSVLTGKNVSHYKEEKLREMHLSMMFMIRSKMKELTGTLIFRPATA